MPLYWKNTPVGSIHNVTIKQLVSKPGGSKERRKRYYSRIVWTRFELKKCKKLIISFPVISHLKESILLKCIICVSYGICGTSTGLVVGGTDFSFCELWFMAERLKLLKNHFGSGEEMIKRNMVGPEIWKTGDGVITNGTREAILNIYRDPEWKWISAAFG